MKEMEVGMLGREKDRSKNTKKALLKIKTRLKEKTLLFTEER